MYEIHKKIQTARLAFKLQHNKLEYHAKIGMTTVIIPDNRINVLYREQGANNSKTKE